MANEFVSTNRGAPGRAQSDFHFGTATTAGDDFEFRMANPVAGGGVPTRKDIVIALENIKRFILNNYGDKYPPL